MEKTQKQTRLFEEVEVFNKTTGVKILVVEGESFFDKLHKSPEEIKNFTRKCKVFCVGGENRSPATVNTLKRYDFEFSDKEPRGSTMMKVAKGIKSGKIDDNRKLMTKGSDHPTDTLIYLTSGFEGEYDGEIAYLIAVLNNLLSKSGKDRLDLNILIVEGDESTIKKLAKQDIIPDYSAAPHAFPDTDQ